MAHTLEQHEVFVANLLNEGPSAEALHWLGESKDHTLECLANAESQQLVIDAYESGATHVIATRIATDAYGANSGDLLVGVPKEADNRKRVFQWCGEMARKQGFDPDADIGQAQLYVKLD